ncbi:MAG: ATP-dependent Clp protease ATP-binding subunit [Bryobacteraceae bacterium]|nr:ATP-dependent Clp protease ATP-binding subunit [Bryobacteraceae bacterium]
MAIDLDKISHELETALERARVLAEQRQQAQISPLHMLYVLLDEEGPLTAMLEKSGVAAAGLLDLFSTKLNSEKNSKLEPGRRPTASSGLRNLIDKSFEMMTRRGAERAEPVDFVMAAIEFGESGLQGDLRQAGVTKDTVNKAQETREATGETLEQKGSAKAPAGGKLLEKFGRDLTALAAKGEMMPVIGREDEVRQVIQTLLRKSKNNPVLVGDPGTGKTAIAEGLAQRIAAGDVPESLKKCKVIALDLTAMVAGAKYRGEFEERIKGVVDEVRARKGEIILFLDEIHTLVGAGGNEGGMDAANILKPALARGELRCLGATTYDEYREKIEKDGALARRFDIVTVKEPSDEMMMVMLRGIRPRFEAFHGVKLADEALLAAVKLSRRYIRSRFLPDKAIDIIDQATARIRMQKESKPTHLDKDERLLIRKKAELEAIESTATSVQGKKNVEALKAAIAEMEPRISKLIEQWNKQKNGLDLLQKTKQAIQQQSALLEAAEGRGDVTEAANIRYGSLKNLELQLADLEKEDHGAIVVPDTVQPEHIAEAIAERTGVPSSRMLESEKERLLNMEARLGERVYGQDEAVVAVAEAARRMRADLQPGRKPNSFLFVGPTGVGKTELAKALAEALLDDESALIRIDMGEYKDKSSAAGLIGSRPGLVGSDEGGFLTEQVRRNPYSIVLFDEVEKGHPEILDLLLGVLDEGRLTDAKGRFCDFSNTMVIFTSNLGVKEAMEATDDLEERKKFILEFVKRTLRPELYNRIGQVVQFNSLGEPQLESIVSKSIGALKRKLADDREIGLVVTPEALTYLAQQSYDPAYGARPVQRTLQQLVLSPLAGIILAGECVAGQTMQIAYDPGEEQTLPPETEGGEPVTVMEGEGLTFGLLEAES